DRSCVLLEHIAADPADVVGHLLVADLGRAGRGLLELGAGTPPVTSQDCVELHGPLLRVVGYATLTGIEYRRHRGNSLSFAHQMTPDSPVAGTLLFGRGSERASLEQAVTAARLGSSQVLVVSGEPGIGKTAMLRCAAEMATVDGMEVLSARGIESEAEVPF